MGGGGRNKRGGGGHGLIHDLISGGGVPNKRGGGGGSRPEFISKKLLHCIAVFCIKNSIKNSVT